MSSRSTICTNCEGTGNKSRSDSDPSPVDCSHCEGTGLHYDGVVHDSDIQGKLDDLKEKVDEIFDIVEALS